VIRERERAIIKKTHIQLEQTQMKQKKKKNQAKTIEGD
jgi:hypothetical protein